MRLRPVFLTMVITVAGAVEAQVPITTALPTTAGLPASLRDRAATTGVTLEGVVDPEAYIVGPGDVFAFSISGRLPVEQRSTVSADGMLILPEVGSFRVGGRSLASVRSDLRDALRRRYSNVDTDVALAEPRRFLVHVTGNVNEPGRHAVIPMARVEDALAAAMGGSPLNVLAEMQSDRNELLPALRNVQLRHRDGRTEELDLRRYYAAGDLAHNPFLRDGDIVHVGTFHRQSGAVFVEDRFGQPVLLDLRPSDSIADLIAVARGPGALDALDEVRLIRTQADGTLDVRTFSGAGLQELGTVAAQSLDRVLLVDPNQMVGRVEVEGAVRFPGTYPVTEGVTTLQEVLEMAGGLRPEALARAAYLDRPGSQRIPYEPFDAARRNATLEDQAYEAGRMAALGFESRQYLSRELASYRRVSVDLQAVLAGTAPEVTLQDGDRLIVPEDPGGVLVIGQVRRPGIVPHQPGARSEQYISAAGGLGPAATETYVREAGSGVVRPADEAEIRSGDVLFVDRGPAAFSESQQGLLLQRQQFEAQIRRDRAEVRNRLITTTLGVIGTVLSAIALYTTLERTN
jgi:protein involved in polysaccharide export with SLBB domain